MQIVLTVGLQIGSYLPALFIGVLGTSYRSGAQLLRVLRHDAADLCEQRPLVHERHILVIRRRAFVAAVHVVFAAADDSGGLAVPLRAATAGRALLLLLLARTLAHTVAILAWTFTLVAAIVGQTPVNIVIVVAQHSAVVVQVLGIVRDTKRCDTRTVPSHAHTFC